MKARSLLLAIALALLPGLAAAQAPESRIQKIKQSKTITLAYRTDAAPFSALDASQQPAGYSIDLCKRVVAGLDQQLGINGLQIRWVPVTTQTRFGAVARGDADIECGSSTVTLDRMKQVDFSNFTFIDGTMMLARADLKARALSDLAGRKIGVVGGTTNERALRNALRDRVVNATVVTLNQRDEGLAKLEAGEIDAFASDQLLLLGLGPKAKNPGSLALVDDPLSFEAYALVLPRGESALRIEVNTALARIYRSDAIVEIYGRWFAALGKPGPMLRVLYTLGGLPD